MAEVTLESSSGPTVSMNDDEAALLDEISIQMPEKRIPMKAKPARPSPFAKRAAGPAQAAPDEGLDMFMNPGKRSAPAPPPVEEYDGEEDEAEDFGQEQGGQEYQGNAGQVPSEGYKTIEDEKADLLNKISRLSKKGIATSARLTIYSDIEEIRTEYKRMMYGIEVDRSIKFQRRMLVACVTGLEFLNDKFDPFDLELNGWSQNMMENVDDYDVVFDILHSVLGPSVELDIERIELVIQELEARHACHEHTALELDRTLNLDRIRHTLVLCANLLNVREDRQALA